MPKEAVIMEVKEAYKILEGYTAFATEITPEDTNRVMELLSMVPKGSKDYNKLEIVFAVLNDPDTYQGKPKSAARALKDYMQAGGLDPGEIMNLSLEARETQKGYGDRERRGHGAVCWG